MTVVDLLSTLARANLAAGAAVLVVVALRLPRTDGTARHPRSGRRATAGRAC